MDFKKDLKWIVEAYNRQLPWDERYTDEGIETRVEEIQKAYDDGNVDFSNYTALRLRQGKKKRDVKLYEEDSAEAFLSIYLHNKLKRRFRVEFPNRNTYIRCLFNTIYALKDMSDYTIYKFDFEDFFNSVSSGYVYRKFIRGRGLERYQEDLLEKFVRESGYAYAGLCTSNAICEIAAQHFDELIQQSCIGRGMIYYRRYIDDGILIFNRYVSEDECREHVQRAIEKVFHDDAGEYLPCKTALRADKMEYIARRHMKAGDPPAVFDYLGYEFALTLNGNKTEVKYGITGEKIKKYRNRIRKFLKQYSTTPNRGMELLRHQIKAFSQRTVYQVVRNNQTIWINKGFLANYHELGNHLDQLSEDTNKFLRYVITDEAKNVLGELPYFLRNSKKSKKSNSDYNPECAYNLFNNLQNNRTQVFVERIGISYETLRSKCREVWIDPDSCKGYDSLLKAYLNKIGVGY